MRSARKPAAAARPPADPPGGGGSGASGAEGGISNVGPREWRQAHPPHPPHPFGDQAGSPRRKSHAARQMVPALGFNGKTALQPRQQGCHC